MAKNQLTSNGKNLETKLSEMKNYYIAQVQVIIDGKETVIIPIAGQGYDPNAVKRSAEGKVRDNNEGKKITSVILEKVDLDIDEFRQTTGNNPSWLSPFGGR